MKILIFCPALGLTSGSGIRARLLAEGLKRAGGDIAVVSSGIPSDWSCDDIRLFNLEPGQTCQKSLLSAAQSFSPDFIYGITEAGADAVRMVAEKLSCHAALDLHGLGFIEVLELGAGYGPRLPRVIASLKWLSNARSVDLVTVANPRLFPLIKYLNRKTFPLFGGTDISLFTPQGKVQKLGCDPDAIQVLYAGNYHKWQGVDLLFEAIRSLGEDIQTFEFTFMGSVGQHREKVLEWQARLPAGRIHFVEAVDYSLVPNYYRGADVLVIPRPFMLSTYLAFPQKLSDYMASGRVVLATDLAPHRWALVQPQSGLLCPSTPGGLATALLDCKDIELRQTLGVRARERAVALFCHLQHGKNLLSIFEEHLVVSRNNKSQNGR